MLLSAVCSRKKKLNKRQKETIKLRDRLSAYRKDNAMVLAMNNY